MYDVYILCQMHDKRHKCSDFNLIMAYIRNIFQVILTMAAALCLNCADSAADDISASTPLRVRGVMESLDMEDVRIPQSLERLDFYSSCGLNTYFYAPADDFARGPRGWRFLYPERDRKNLSEMMEACAERGMEFVWTIDTGNDYKWNKQDYDLLKNKLIIMYHSGIRSFALAFTGVEALPSRMKKLKAQLDKDFVSQRNEPVSLVLMDDYTMARQPSSSVGPKALMQGVELNDELRDAAVSSSSIVCDVKVRSEIYKLNVVAVADFGLSPFKYDNEFSRERAVEMLAPEVKDAYLTFIRHSSVVNESEGVETFTLAEYSKEKAETLMSEFRKIAAVPDIMIKCDRKELLGEMAPWLEQFGALGRRGIMVMEALQYYIDGNLGQFWISYVDSMMSEQDRESYHIYKCGSVKLQPFYEKLMSDLIASFTSRMTAGGTVRIGKITPELFAALDSDYASSVHVDGRAVFNIPAVASECHILTGKLPSDGKVYLRQLARDGSLVAEFPVRSPYMTMPLKKGSVKVDIIGNVDVFETIFVYL